MTNNGHYNSTNAPITAIHSNTNQDLIVITEDKLQLILIECVNNLNKTKEIFGPLGILITIVITYCTTNFKEFFGINPFYWQVLFATIFIVTFYMTVTKMYKAFILPSISIDGIIKKIKNTSDNKSSNSNN